MAKKVSAHLSKDGNLLTVNVHPRHIREGKPRCGFGCPVALAVSELFGADKIAVDHDYIAVWGEGVYDIYRGSIRLKRFIRNVDYGRKVRPTSFRLRKAGS